MIKFFRKIRQNLLMENKTSKYFKYAIGEIVLVVIGILIALQISNWNESLKGKKLVKIYVEGLVRDLKQDSTDLNSAIQFHKENGIGLKALINLKNRDINKTSVNDSIYKLFRKYGVNLVVFISNNNTLTQLKNTGDLALFSKRVRDSIISHENDYERVKSQGDFYRDSYKNNQELSKKNIDYTVLINTLYFKDRKHTGRKLPKINFTNNLKMEFFNELSLLKGTSDHYLENYLKLYLQKTERLISFLTEEYSLKN